MEGVNRVVEEPEITPDATAELAPAEATSSDGSGERDGSAASCPTSLTHEQQVHNLKKNFKKALDWAGVGDNFDEGWEVDPWFASIVAKLRDDPFFNSREFEIDGSLVGGSVKGLGMTSLDLAILMEDPEMVDKIFEMVDKIFEMVDKILKGDPDSNIVRLPGGLVDSLTLENYIPSVYSVFHKRIVNILVAMGAHNAFMGVVETGLLYTPLHLAIVIGNSYIVDALLERGADVNAPNWKCRTPLDFAWKLGNVTMLQKLLEKDAAKKNPLHVPVRYGDVELMKKLPFPNVNVVDKYKRTPLHHLATIQFHGFDIRNIVQYFAEDKTLDIKALDSCKLSAFYVAVLNCNKELVIAFLEFFKDKIRLNEECDEDHGPPIQIAFEGGHSFKDIERALMECESVKSYMDTLYRDRQVYVDAANAILVGAALIASVTFASWLQPPLNYTSYFGDGYSSSTLVPSTSNLNYVDVEHNIPLRAFWVFNALSFYFAIATVVCGARSVLPRSHLFIKKTVEKLHINLMMTSILLACSVLFVIIAFAIAGTIVLTPLVKYQWCMIVPTIVGGMVCIISLGFLIKSMKEIHSSTRDDSKKLGETFGKRDYLESKGYAIESIEEDLI